MYDLSSQRGASAIKVLVGVVAIALVGVMVYLVFNPQKKLADQRNARRLADVTAIVQAIDQYTRANGTVFPKTITTTPTDICKMESKTCAGLIDLSAIKQYANTLPSDPSGSSENSTGYSIVETSDRHIVVSAPHAENGAIIKVTW